GGIGHVQLGARERDRVVARARERRHYGPREHAVGTCHQHPHASSTRLESPSIRRYALGRESLAVTTTSRPIRLDSIRPVMVCRWLPSRTIECSISQRSILTPSAMALNGPT